MRLVCQTSKILCMNLMLNIGTLQALSLDINFNSLSYSLSNLTFIHYRKTNCSLHTCEDFLYFYIPTLLIIKGYPYTLHILSYILTLIQNRIGALIFRKICCIGVTK